MYFPLPKPQSLKEVLAELLENEILLLETKWHNVQCRWDLTVQAIVCVLLDDNSTKDAKDEANGKMHEIHQQVKQYQNDLLDFSREFADDMESDLVKKAKLPTKDNLKDFLASSDASVAWHERGGALINA